MTINELASIAARYLTTMADAMIRACVTKAVETGEPLEVPERGRLGRCGKRPPDDPDAEEWRRMVEGNSETSAIWKS